MNQNNYEIIYIVKPEIEKFSTIEEKVYQLLENDQIEIKSLGTKEFAYPINKKTSGSYFQINLRTDSNKIEKFNNKIKSVKEIIRVLIVNLDKEKHFKAKKHIFSNNRNIKNKKEESK